jgi:hypothetical protein
MIDPQFGLGDETELVQATVHFCLYRGPLIGRNPHPNPIEVLFMIESHYLSNMTFLINVAQCHVTPPP